MEKGLKYCTDRRMFYFPDDLLQSDRLYFPKPDGSQTNIAVAGRRKYWRPGKESYYRYYLAPNLSVFYASSGQLTITVRVRIRFTDDDGIPYSNQRTVSSRRKHLCQGWWNREWFYRTLAVMHFLGDGEPISIGPDEKSSIVISNKPDSWQVSTRLKEEAIKSIDSARDEILAYIPDDDDEEDDDE